MSGRYGEPHARRAPEAARASANAGIVHPLVSSARRRKLRPVYRNRLSMLRPVNRNRSSMTRRTVADPPEGIGRYSVFGSPASIHPASIHPALIHSS